MRWLRRLFLPVSTVVLVLGAWRAPLPLFLEVPGDAVSIGERVTVAVAGGQELDGDFLLLTVNLRRGTVARVVQGLVDPTIALVEDRRLIPPGVPDNVFFDQQRALFRATAEIAAAVALREAGYDVDPAEVTGDGVLVVRVLPGSPADGRLAPGDVITGVDGRPVHITDDLQQVVQAGMAQSSLVLTVERDGDENDVLITPGLIPTAQGEIRGLGVQIETRNPRVRLPVAVEVDGGRIGGPSAGLMIALTVYDLVAEEDLAAGRQIAGTGGLDASGQVRSIGGIAQKVVAAERREVDILLVPAVQAEAAVAARSPGSGLRIVPVATFQEAVAALRPDLAAAVGR
jgi:Lon-like protease